MLSHLGREQRNPQEEGERSRIWGRSYWRVVIYRQTWVTHKRSWPACRRKMSWPRGWGERAAIFVGRAMGADRILSWHPNVNFSRMLHSPLSNAKDTFPPWNELRAWERSVTLWPSFTMTTWNGSLWSSYMPGELLTFPLNSRKWRGFHQDRLY